MSSSSSTADDILACARSLIMSGGYNGFSYADIAEVVGIRKASIHHHFPSKVDLVCAVVQRYREEAKAGFAALERSAAGPREMLENYVGYWQKCIADASAPFCICALLASELPLLPIAVAAEVKLHFEALSAWLTAAMERGKTQGTLALSNSANAEAETFIATVHGGMLSARAYGDPKFFTLVTGAALDRLSS